LHQKVNKHLKRFLSIAAILFSAFSVIFWLYPPQWLGPFVSAYGLSLIFTGSNFWVMRKLNLCDHSQFMRLFGISLAIRFLVVLSALLLILSIINNHQIFFTVSFIISYICHSVMEVIFLNKILETDIKE